MVELELLVVPVAYQLRERLPMAVVLAAVILVLVGNQDLGL
mgnify:CR=1 FL=1